MRQRTFLIGALFLLLILIGFMIRDLFFSGTPKPENPYAFDLKSAKTGKPAAPAFQEIKGFRPSLTEIHTLSVDGADRVYVGGEGGVEVFNREGNGLFKFPVNGSVKSMIIDTEGNIFLGVEDHLEIYSKTGKLLRKWKSCGKESVLTSIALSDSFVFLADAGNRVVYRYDGNGTLINRIGEKDPARKIPGFVIPSPYFDLAVSKDGFLWVVNPGRHLFEKYTFDGNLISSWGEASMAIEGFCGCCNPSNFAFLSDGCFVTSEKAIERVKIYSSTGKFKAVVALPVSFEEGTKGLDLAVDSKDRILVLDPIKKMVRIFIMRKTKENL